MGSTPGLRQLKDEVARLKAADPSRSQNDVAELLSLDSGQLSRLLKRRARPDLDTAAHLEVITDGRVRAVAFARPLAKRKPLRKAS